MTDKKYVTMVDFSDYDVRCRCDIDTHPSFIRNNDVVLYHNTKKYTIVYEGNEKLAKDIKSCFIVLRKAIESDSHAN